MSIFYWLGPQWPTFCTHFACHSSKKKSYQLRSNFYRSFFSKHQIENEWPLIQVFARCRTDTKHSPTLPDPDALKPSTFGDQINPAQHSKCHCCWCHGSLRRQDIGTHDIDNVEQRSPCLIRGRISTTCVMSMWRNDIKCKYIYTLPRKKIST